MEIIGHVVQTNDGGSVQYRTSRHFPLRSYMSPAFSPVMLCLGYGLPGWPTAYVEESTSDRRARQLLLVGITRTNQIHCTAINGRRRPHGETSSLQDVPADISSTVPCIISVIMTPRYCGHRRLPSTTLPMRVLLQTLSSLYHEINIQLPPA